MARPANPHPTDGELEILRILWREGPIELGELRRQLQDARGRDLASTTVATMLSVMEGKGFVKKATGSKSYRWSARVTRRTTSRGLVGRVVDGVFEGSMKGLVAHIIADGRLSETELDEIRLLLDQEQPGTTRSKRGSS